ncbi:amino acid--tRNA ligase-related protein [Leptospira ilyithenensis]|uniref:Elongation factor P--(R)-beta-lysine ligase n=1 Tax=Leptospira ilyithenensis TaxID=2484901 RepID=A0A4R9LVJ1_9LEPT|nr:amino acid--tRNA ligase-related protein [Leptospira ilyithenensis]TGN14610.1 elongation factor P--(R)-beta-lysine ligase [Leptospira ilyithenensis]
MKPIPFENQILRSRFLRSTRSFLEESGFLEMDTPCFKPVVGMEPYLDPFLVSSPDGREKGYLITSPEYSLKQSLANGLERIYEITHTFRSGEEGSPYHSAEFLMLELYVKGWNDKDLRDFSKEYFKRLGSDFSELQVADFLTGDSSYEEISVDDIVKTHTKRGLSRKELIETIFDHRLTSAKEDELVTWQYEDLFFLVFLNLVEPKLGDKIVFLYDYPPECAALAKIVDGKAKRFEIYWSGLELANAFWELTDSKEQRSRFIEEQTLREGLGKEIFPIDEDFLFSLESGKFPDSSGISLGLDRIFMRLVGGEGLKSFSPYYG